MQQKPYREHPLTFRVISFLASITEVILVPLYSVPIFENFPNNIPFLLRHGVPEDLGRLFAIVDDLKSRATPDTSESAAISFSHPFTKYEFEYDQMRKHLGTRSGPPDFKKIILRQAWTQMISVWETFLQDSLILLFLENPDQLIRFGERQMRWADLISSENLMDLHHSMAKICAKDFDTLPIIKQIEWLKKSNIDLKMTDEELQTLIKNYQIRHIIVHNNAIIDEKYISVVGVESKENLGQEVILTTDMLEGLHKHLSKLGANFYGEIADKHFNIPKSEQFFQHSEMQTSPQGS